MTRVADECGAGVAVPDPCGGQAANAGGRVRRIDHPAIAREAGVSAQTVYAAFGSKAGLFKRIVDVGIVGDEELIPVSGRAIVDDVRSARSATARFALFADFVAGVHERLADIVEIGLAAAGSDAEIAS